MNNNLSQTILISVAIAMVVSFFALSMQKTDSAETTAAVKHYLENRTEGELIADFYRVENAVHVSPHSVRTHLGDNDIVLVDLRSQEEYETLHIITAINIPAYATPDKSDYGSVDAIVGAFKDAQAKNPGKDIVVYCYSIPCMTGRKIGKMLLEHDIYVQHLGIGWNEWRYYWKLWNHDGEKQVNPLDYVSSGKEPGIFMGDKSPGCPIGGEFGC